MKALARLPSANGIAATQAVNVTVLNPVFLPVFLGIVVLCLGLVVVGIIYRATTGAGWLLASSLLYLLGTFLVTVVCNVPLNNRLAAVTPSSTAGAELWAHYLARWTAWNHVRTVAALSASVGFMVALL